MSEHIVHVNDAEFDAEVSNASLPVLVDFWAEWCGPCKMIAPVLDEISKDYADKLKICKMDVDANKEVAQKFGVRGIPTLLIFKDGNVVGQKVGALSKNQLIEFIDSTI